MAFEMFTSNLCIYVTSLPLCSLLFRFAWIPACNLDGCARECTTARMNAVSDTTTESQGNKGEWEISRRQYCLHLNRVNHLNI